MEFLIKIGSYFADRVPECGCRRFEETRSPSRHCELASRTNRLPEGANSCRHIGDEKNSKNADHGIELCVGQVHIKQVANPKLRIHQAALCRLRSRKFKEVRRKVDAQNEPLWPNHLGGGQSRRSTAAAHVKHT